MKKFLKGFIALSLGLAMVGCAKEYDDTALKSKVDELSKEVSKLSQDVKDLNSQVVGFKEVIDQWKAGGYVESVQPVKEGDKEVGQTITFLGGKTVTIYYGKDGKDGDKGDKGDKGDQGDPGTPGTNGTNGTDGKTPEITIGTIAGAEGLYWLVDGEALKVDGKPVPATVLPVFSINAEGHLIVTINGEDQDLGLVKGAGGDSMFKSVEVTETGVTFTPATGDPFTIPFAKKFKLVIEQTEQEVAAGKTVKIPYSVQNANESTTVDVFAGGDYLAKVVEGNIEVTAPDPFVNGQVLAWAQNDEGLFSMVKLSFVQNADLKVVTLEEDYQAIPAEAGDFVVNVTSNVDVDVVIPEAATWVTAQVTKTDYKITFTLEANETGEPREAEIAIVRKDNGQELQTIKIAQLFGEPEPDPVVYYVFDGAAGKHGISTKESTYQPYAWTASNAMETVPAGYLEKADWKVTLGNVQNNGSGDFWFGANSGNKDKLTFGNSGYAEAEAIAAALDVKTDAKHYGALICTSNLPTISKIEITSTADMGGGQATTMWVVKSTDNGTTYSVVKKIDMPAKAANTLFTIKIAKADRSASASYALVFYREGGQFQYKAPKITFYSADPTPVEKEVAIERLWGYYPNSGWPTSFVPANADRGVATDGENVYVTNTTDGTVVGIKITDQSKVTVNMTGVDGGFFKTCSAKTIYNPSTGKYILLVGSLANDSDCNFNVYAWKDGIDQAPTKIISWNTNNGSPRRIGDFFTVSGDWSNGEIWARINQADPAAATTFVWKITDGVAGGVLGGGIGYAGSAGMGSVYKYSLDAPQVMVVTPNIAKFYTCKVESTWINANSDGIEWTDGSDVSAYAKRFGYTPFEFNGKKYIAYLHMYNAARGWLTVLNDTQGTAEGFMKTIIDNDIFFQGAVQINKDEASTDVVAGATYSGNTMANCSVAVLKDEVIIVGHQQNTGLAVFKMYLK